MILTRLDLSDAENVNDARHEYLRCGSDSAFAAWAKKWGAAIFARLDEAQGHEDAEGEGWDDLTREEAKNTALRNAMEAAVKALDGLVYPTDALANQVGDITSKLEAAL